MYSVMSNFRVRVGGGPPGLSLLPRGARLVSLRTLPPSAAGARAQLMWAGGGKRSRGDESHWSPECVVFVAMEGPVGPSVWPHHTAESAQTVHRDTSVPHWWRNVQHNQSLESKVNSHHSTALNERNRINDNNDNWWKNELLNKMMLFTGFKAFKILLLCWWNYCI
jgi:hypothetical protein